MPDMKWIPVTERLPENDKPYEEYIVNIMADHYPVSTWDDDPYCEEYVTEELADYLIEAGLVLDDGEVEFDYNAED